MSCEPLNQAVGQFVEARRLAQGLTRYAIAQAGGPGESTLRALESGEHAVQLCTFVAVCKALDADPAIVLRDLLRE